MSQVRVVARWVRPSVVLILSALVLGLALDGCSFQLKPCAGVAIGARYGIQVGVVDPRTEFTDNCAADWGFAEGELLTAEIVGEEENDSCASGVAELSGSTGWSSKLVQPGDAQGGGLIESHYTVQREACTGDAHVSVDCSACSAFAAGTACGCRLILSLTSTGRSCPGTCVVTLTSQVTRL